MLRKKAKGFSLIELLIVVAIIGILAAILVPNLLMAIHKGRQKSTMADMHSIVTGLEAYATDYDRYPDTNNVTDLTTILVPFYMKSVKTKDAWGHDFTYLVDDNADHYWLWSPGKNPDCGDVANCDTNITTPNIYEPATQLSDFNKELCYSDGILMVGPKR